MSYKDAKQIPVQIFVCRVPLCGGACVLHVVDLATPVFACEDVRGNLKKTKKKSILCSSVTLKALLTGWTAGCQT